MRGRKREWAEADRQTRQRDRELREITLISVPIDWGPEISNDFIAVFPRQPLRGQYVRLECLAYGT